MKLSLFKSGDERAGATQSVTLAGDLHVVDDSLEDDDNLQDVRSDQI